MCVCVRACVCVCVNARKWRVALLKVSMQLDEKGNKSHLVCLFVIVMKFCVFLLVLFAMFVIL